MPSSTEIVDSFMAKAVMVLSLFASTAAQNTQQPAQTQIPNLTGININALIDPTTPNGPQKEALKASLAKLANDPDGAKLLQQAARKGVTFEVGGNAAFAAEMGGTASLDEISRVKGLTVSNGNGSSKIILRDPNDMQVMAHELVHASTSADHAGDANNSQHEEGISNVMGELISRRINGQGLSDAEALQIYKDTVGIEFYQRTLARSGDIEQDLAKLGVSVPNIIAAQA